MPNGPLSLPTRLHLLAWNTTRREVTDPARLPPLVRAGALADLARRGLLIDDDGIATPLDLDSRTGDAVLDGLLELVSESCPHRWRTWVTLHARYTLDAVREQLVAEGFLHAEKRRVLGVFPSVEYVLDGVARVDALQDEARLILDGPVPAGDVPEADAAVVALAASAGLRTLLPDRDRARHERRIEELTERGGARDARPRRDRARTARGGEPRAVPTPLAHDGRMSPAR
ncbi:integral membrane protein [Streptomyces viridosporus ATCC 14672]|uniref:Integral membrane protein n=1 Tax=Streptomyces viridosporus (strain ATCC 14672 / DSM 40746 / JCM 4963 / KCTC 9882 / NRRL B-12104 / FH 1290) TaxID=566461 RepID=D6A323_STRV1|nr:GPP34 family phosphoprotein [Streptomyces viridosporus]EFE65698.1 integral membrane protein [Streptomyces viridosporus ATCC 14672]